MKSLFWRYLTMTMLLLLISFSLFGFFFIVQSYTYTLGQLKTTLEDDSRNVGNLTSLYFGSRDSMVARSMFTTGISAVVYENDEQIIICDSKGKLLYFANRDGYTEGFTQSISNEIMTEVFQNGSYSETGTLGGLYQSVSYSSGRCVVNENGIVLGAVFVSAPVDSARVMFEYYQQIFFIIGLIVLLIGMVVSYIMTRYMVRPLRAMTKATRAYAMGDFSLRLPEDRTDEIGELAHSMNQMSASLNKLEELRSSFIANVSHELKTPMTTIAGFADGILDGTIPPEREREYLTIISKDTRRLSRLVVRMLQASRLSSGEIQLHPGVFDLAEMISLNLLEFQNRIEEKNQAVDVSFEQDRMFVRADQDYIAQVVYNLLDNACKYGEENGVLRVSAVSENGKIRVTVSNSGAEIPADMLPYVFDRFYKTDKSRGIDSSSTGLGLFIVKSILNMHGESISVTSANGVTSFTFTLPVAADNRMAAGGRHF
ncbi:MAG: HAMP domain-containing histidine kinase [Ruminococcaceae bacterium]|nr:HAMP domain-containing histidine kinase [Oscillospiraceae bacterium]